MGTAPAGTTVTITASFPGYANGTATITYANSGFVVYGPNGIGGAFQTFQGVQTSLTVYAARLDSSGLFVEPENVAKGSTISVPIASSSTSVGDGIADRALIYRRHEQCDGDLYGERHEHGRHLGDAHTACRVHDSDGRGDA